LEEVPFVLFNLPGLTEALVCSSELGGAQAARLRPAGKLLKEAFSGRLARNHCRRRRSAARFKAAFTFHQPSADATVKIAHAACACRRLPH